MEMIAKHLFNVNSCKYFNSKLLAITDKYLAYADSRSIDYPLAQGIKAK